MGVIPYDIITVPLGVAGRQTIPNGSWDFFNFITAFNPDGTRNMDAQIRVAFGKNSNVYAPVEQNNSLEGFFDQVNLEWDAQPGVVAQIFISSKTGNSDAMRLYAPPAKQLVTFAAGTLISQGVVSVGSVATVIAPANALRQGLTIQNRSSTIDVEIGSATVTAAGATRGILLKAGAAMEIRDTTAAIYGITAAGSADVGYLSEES